MTARAAPFKALVLHLISQSDIESVSLQTSVPVSTLYDWQSDWNKKKSRAYKTLEGRVADQNHAYAKTKKHN